MSDQFLLLFFGFLLTTVAGGFLGFYFQSRTWNANRRETERQAAASVFDELSRTLDRRLYRMRLLNWRLGSGDKVQIEEAMAAYRESLVEWNDNLNRNLALAYRYFGEAVWSHLDKTVYEEFASLGRDLETRYADRLRERDEVASRAASMDELLAVLSDKVYELNRFMIALVQQGKVGLYQTSAKEWAEAPPWSLKSQRDR